MGDKNVSRMKQVLSSIGIVLLLALYLITFVLAITDNSASLQLFYASVVATIVIPTLIWIYTSVFRMLNRKDEGEQKDAEKEDKEK